MSDIELIAEILAQITEASQRIERRFLSITGPDDFLNSTERMGSDLTNSLEVTSCECRMQESSKTVVCPLFSCHFLKECFGNCSAS